MRKAGATSGASIFGGFSALTGQLTAHGQQFQTFEAGPTLVLVENPEAHSKFEITVERDDLRGDEDEIELGFHGSKDGETQTAGAKFRLTFTMKQEAGTWRLNEISVTIGVSLTDPEFLKAMTTRMTPAAMSMVSSQSLGQRSVHADRNERGQRICRSRWSPHAQYGRDKLRRKFSCGWFYLHPVRLGWHGKRRRRDRAPGNVDRSAAGRRQEERLRLRAQRVRRNSGVEVQHHRRACGSEFRNARLLQR